MIVFKNEINANPIIENPKRRGRFFKHPTQIYLPNEPNSPLLFLYLRQPLQKKKDKLRHFHPDRTYEKKINSATFAKRFASEMCLENQQEVALRIILKIFQGLKHSFTTKQSIQFGSYLNQELKLKYRQARPVNGLKKEKHNSLDQLVNRVLYIDQNSHEQDFKAKLEALEAILALFVLIKKDITKEDYRNMAALLPEDLPPVLEFGKCMVLFVDDNNRPKG